MHERSTERSDDWDGAGSIENDVDAHSSGVWSSLHRVRSTDRYLLHAAVPWMYTHLKREGSEKALRFAGSAKFFFLLISYDEENF